MTRRAGPAQGPDRQRQHQHGHHGEADSRVGPPVEARVERARQPEHGHRRLVGQVGQQPFGVRESGDRGPAQVRRTRLEQAVAARLDDEDLLLGPVGPPGRPVHGLPDQRGERGGGEDGPGERRAGGGPPAEGRPERAQHQLGQDDRGAGGVAVHGDGAPGAVRQKVRPGRRVPGEAGGEQVEQEVEAESVRGTVERGGYLLRPALHGAQCVIPRIKMRQMILVWSSVRVVRPTIGGWRRGHLGRMWAIGTCGPVRRRRPRPAWAGWSRASPPATGRWACAAAR